MAGLAVGISGRVEVGETLRVVYPPSVVSVQWQSYVAGAWVNIGVAGSQTYTIPSGATGAVYRVVVSDGSLSATSAATGAVTLDSNKVGFAPTLTGVGFIAEAYESTPAEGLFSLLSFADADKSNYANGSLQVINSAFMPGGAANDTISLRFAGTASGQFSYNASTREVKYAFTAGSPVTIGVIDANQQGIGGDFKIVFNSNATKAVVDALIDNIRFLNTDDSPVAERVLTLRVTDGTGGSVQHALVLPVVNTPDAPVFASSAVFSIAENQALPVGVVSATDPDLESGEPQTMSYSLVAGAGDADNAHFHINATSGALGFGDMPDYEQAGHAPVYSVRVRASDGNGGSTDQMITVTVLNVNEAPVVGAAVGAEVVEAGVVLPNTPAPGVSAVQGILQAVDPDAGDTMSWTGSTLGTYGNFLVNASTGQWAYALDNASLATQALAEGQSAQETFMATVTDSHGAVSQQQVVITVEGTNDKPEIGSGGVTTGTVTEPAAGGGVLVSDFGSPYAGDYTAVPVSGGQMLVLGQVASDLGGTYTALSRYNSDGSLDETFGNAGRAGSAVQVASDFATDVQGRHLVVGYNYASYGSTRVDWAIQRLNADGSADASFGQGGLVTLDFAGGYDYADRVWVQPGGKILVMGEGPRFVRFNEDGSVDSGFGNGGQLTNTALGSHQGAAMDIQGRILFWRATTDEVSGSARLEIERYSEDGAADLAFGELGHLSIDTGKPSVSDARVSVAPNGDIVAAWSAQTPELFQNQITLVRLGPNGDPDTSFGSGGVVVTPFLSWWFDLAVDAQGRPLLSLSQHFDADGRDFQIARLNSDGSTDLTFGDAGVVTTDFNGGDDRVGAIRFDPEGYVLVQGWSEADGADVDFALASYNEDGSLNQAFGTPPSALPTVSGTLGTASDPDAGSVLSWSGSAVGIYGDFTVDGAGAWSYVLDPTRAATNALNQDEQVTEQFVVTLTDNHGAVDTVDVVITVVGSYDAPVV